MKCNVKHKPFANATWDTILVDFVHFAFKYSRELKYKVVVLESSEKLLYMLFFVSFSNIVHFILLVYIPLYMYISNMQGLQYICCKIWTEDSLLNAFVLSRGLISTAFPRLASLRSLQE